MLSIITVPAAHTCIEMALLKYNYAKLCSSRQLNAVNQQNTEYNKGHNYLSPFRS